MGPLDTHNMGPSLCNYAQFLAVIFMASNRTPPDILPPHREMSVDITLALS